MAAIIRKMKKKDIGEVHQVARESWRATYAGIIPEEIQQRFIDRAYSSDMLKIRMKRSILLVAEENNRIAGFANFSPVRDGVSELIAIYLLPDFQRKGLGSRFLKEGIGMLSPQELRLNVEKQNEAATDFYRSKGFEIMEEFEEDFDGHTLHTVKMSMNPEGNDA